MRGSLEMRAAEVRPLSTITTTRRSRSGRQVRTTRRGPVPASGSVRRAVARQSMERTSSPRTYSRRLSNSVPCPRIITLVAPSSSRRRASRDGRCRRELKAGSTRIAPGRAIVACRATSPSGPNDRMVIADARRSPRRNGVSVVTTKRRSPSGSTIRVRVGNAPADGCQASRTMPRRRRWPVFVRLRVEVTVSPSLTLGGTSRAGTTALGEPASRRSPAPTSSTSTSHAPSHTGSPSATIGSTPTATSSTNQPEMAI